MKTEYYYPFVFFIIGMFTYQFKLYFHFRYLQQFKKKYLNYRNFFVFEFKGKSVGGTDMLYDSFMFYFPSIIINKRIRKRENRKTILLVNFFSVLTILLLLVFFILLNNIYATQQSI